MIVYNSTFKKNIDRYIFDMHTDEPYIEPQYYTQYEPHGAMNMSAGKFEFDGQIFYRRQINGGNRPSSWCIMGSGECLK